MKTNTPNTERLEQAYSAMLQQVAADIEALSERNGRALHEILEHARTTVAAAQALQAEEAAQVAAAVRRDMHDLGLFLEQTDHDWRGWLRIDLALIEASILDAISKVADRTKLEWTALAEQAYRVGEWHTGEVTGPGELICLECGGSTHLSRIDIIPQCTHCGHTRFQRGGPVPGGME